MYVRMRVCTYVFMHACMYVRMYLCVYVLHIYIHIYAYMHTYMHTCNVSGLTARLPILQLMFARSLRLTYVQLLHCPRLGLART